MPNWSTIFMILCSDVDQMSWSNVTTCHGETILLHSLDVPQTRFKVGKRPSCNHPQGGSESPLFYRCKSDIRVDIWLVSRWMGISLVSYLVFPWNMFIDIPNSCENWKNHPSRHRVLATNPANDSQSTDRIRYNQLEWVFVVSRCQGASAGKQKDVLLATRMTRWNH